MSDHREDRIRQRAHAIWEAEGRPEGRSDHHWAQAEREIGAQDGAEATGSAPSSAPVKAGSRNRGKRAPQTGSGAVIGSGAGAGGGGNREDFDTDSQGGGGALGR